MENYDYNTRRHRLFVQSLYLMPGADDDADLLLLLCIIMIMLYGGYRAVVCVYTCIAIGYTIHGELVTVTLAVAYMYTSLRLR